MRRRPPKPTIDHRTPYRPARLDERCSCGGHAVVVYLTDDGEQIPSCGLSLAELRYAIDRHPANGGRP